MRKDVQIGFIIGVVLLAGLVVYVLVIPGGNKRGAELAVGPDTSTTLTDALPTTRPVETTTPTAISAPTTPAVTNAGGPTTMPAVTTGTRTGSIPSPTRSRWSGLLDGSETLTPTMGHTTERTVGTAAVGPSVTGTIGQPTTRPSSATSLLGDAATGTTGTVAARTHTVQKGETLTSIAKAAYGNSNYYLKIQAANPGINPKTLKVGQVIKLPAIETGTTATPDRITSTLGSTDTHSTVTGKTYKVQSGDTLQGIAVKVYGKRSMADKIYEMNKAAIGSSPNHLKLGMTLRLPEVAATATPTVSTHASTATTGLTH